MSAGTKHARDSILVAVAGLAWGWSAGQPMTACAFAVGATAGILLSPDLDQDHRTISENIIVRRSKLAGWAWYLFWWPYAKLVPHRSALSHFPIVGTLGRLFYLALPLIILGWWPPVPISLVGWIIGGLMISDTVHWIRDGVSTNLRRVTK